MMSYCGYVRWCVLRIETLLLVRRYYVILWIRALVCVEDRNSTTHAQVWRHIAFVSIMNIISATLYRGCILSKVAYNDYLCHKIKNHIFEPR